MIRTTDNLARFKEYGEYRDSGVNWLDRVPTHWQVLPLKRLGWFKAGAGFPDNEQGLAAEELPFYKVSDMNLNANAVYMVEHNNSVSRDTATRLGATVFPPDAIVFAKVGAALLLNKRRMLTRPSCIDNNTMAFIVERGDVKYIYYHLLCLDLGGLANPGAVPSINESQLREIAIAVPPNNEQRKIAMLLDRETARIDGLVAKKRRLIELLEEKRTALISQAVTKGLDPTVPMKDSGVEWIGGMPTHWQPKQLKYLSRLQTGVTLGKKYDNEQKLISRPYLRVANVQDGYLDLSHITSIQIPLADVGRYELKPGDVLMTEGGDFDKLGRGYVWDGQIADCLHQNHIFAVRPDQRALDSHFLASLLSSSHGRNYFTSTSQQTTNLASTNSTKLRAFPVPLPPKNEQNRIMRFVRDVSTSIGQISTGVQKAVQLLSEYRTALISAAVTGKIDVRVASDNRATGGDRP